MKKRFLSLLLAAALLCGVLTGVGVSAEEDGFNTNLTGWNTLNGAWETAADGLHSAGVGDCFAISSVEVADFIFEAKVHLEGAGAASLVFRSNDNGSAAYIVNVDSNGYARMFKFPGVGTYEFGGINVDPTLTEHTMRVVAVGSTIRYYIDEKLVTAVNDTSYRTGKLGLLHYGTNGDFRATFQDVQYTAIDGSDIPVLTDIGVVGDEDALCFDESLTEFHGRVPYATDSVTLTAAGKNVTGMTVTAVCDGRTLMREKAFTGDRSPEIPLSVGVTTITLRVNGSLAALDGEEVSSIYAIKLRRMEAGATATGSNHLTYADVVGQMTDLTALADPVQPGEASAEFTSYDQRATYSEVGGYQNWDANDDFGNNNDRERTADGGLVLAKMEGPGAIVRFWSAEPHNGKVKIFIDGNPEPVVDTTFASYFGGDFPFSFEHISYDASRGQNSYVPIPYNESCQVVAYGDWGRYYHIGYITFADGTTVESFSLPLSADGQKALVETERLFAGDYTMGLGDAAQKTVTVPAGGSVELFTASGAGAIERITAKVSTDGSLGDDWNALAELAISAYWDGESAPSVWTTLGGFFGSITGVNAYSSLPMGVYEDGTMYANWYMPYSEGAKITLQNDGDSPRTVTYTVSAVTLEKSAADNALRFHAKWNRMSDTARTAETWPDSPFLELEGSGRYVGTSLHIYKAIGTGDPAYSAGAEWWWGEGDEKFYVDGEAFPSWYGTGSEDYFGYAWGSWVPFSYPYHAQPFTNGGMFGIGNRLNNRWHILDNVPFTDSFRACLEKYHRDDYANMVVTNYFYLEKGVADGYQPVSLEARTSYYDLPYPEPATFYEGETMKIIESLGMEKAETQNMTRYGAAWSGGAQLVYKGSLGGYMKLYLNVPYTGRYDLSAYFTRAVDFGIAQHYLDGEALGAPVDAFGYGVSRSPETSLAKSMELTAGLHVLEVRITGKNPQSSGYFYGLDCLQLVALDPPPVTSTPESTAGSTAGSTAESATAGGNAPSDGLPIGWILGGVAAVVLIGAGVAAVLIIRKKRKG